MDETGSPMHVEPRELLGVWSGGLRGGRGMGRCGGTEGMTARAGGARWTTLSQGGSSDHRIRKELPALKGPYA